jgi:2-C-methyl-D-erythritol 2,4-cyclodiphosphate synthase
MRVGIGYDIHRLVKGRKLILGGIDIPFHKGLEGHSDADVLLHAISDALLGACGFGDIGEHFPDTDPAYKDISSVELLKKIYELVEGSVYKITNIDTVVICQEPKLGGFKHAIRSNIADILDINIEKVNVKAKTTENTDTDTVSAYAVALLEP